MNVSFRWLSQFFDDGVLDELGPAGLAQRLTDQGLAVDELRPAFGPFSGVILAKVLTAKPHPDADRLTLCTVDAGDGSRQVVCGAPNVEVGALYGYAQVGAKLPGGSKIRRAKIRGVESDGMLCSAPELGLDALGSAEGIWAIPDAEEADLGRDLRETLGLDDTILVIDVTSNRGDALSHLGIARETQWITGKRMQLPRLDLSEGGRSANEQASVEVEDRDGCSRYLGRVINNVSIGPSPGWLQTRLLALDQRPINNIVDVTNYVMLEVGQPLHAFDLERISNAQIVVRRAHEGERMETLDGQERVLTSEMTMIADAREVVAIGGVMGGTDSEVSSSTTEIFLEGAHFDPSRVGRTARRLGMVSEASTRFSRGVDPEITGWAIDRAADMIAQFAGGRVAPGVVGMGANVEPRATGNGALTLRDQRVKALVGYAIPVPEITRALESLGFGAESATDRALAVTVPSWRFDVAREIDLIEEIARLTGYSRIPMEALPAPPIAPEPTGDERRTTRVRETLRAAGFDEAQTPSFVDSATLATLELLDNLVEIKNPISQSQRFLRPYVFTTLGSAVAYNLNRQASRVKLFEIGHAFDGGTESERAPLRERRRVAMVAAGARGALDWTATDQIEYDFFDLKGDVEELLTQFGLSECVVDRGARRFLHPGRQAELTDRAGNTIGFCGELHPAVTASWGLTSKVFVAELGLDALPADGDALSVADVPREPAIARDLALVVPDGDTAQVIIEAVRSVGLEDLERVEVFDRYRGVQVDRGYYSLGVRLTFRTDRTLTDDEVDEQVDHLMGHLVEERGYRRR
jgi:phenylalanyl-tRNA synthetase beta chain